MKHSSEVIAVIERLKAKIEATKGQPGPVILSVHFRRTTGEPYLKCYGPFSEAALHAKYDPELREFTEITRPKNP